MYAHSKDFVCIYFSNCYLNKQFNNLTAASTSTLGEEKKLHTKHVLVIIFSSDWCQARLKKSPLENACYVCMYVVNSQNIR